MANGTVIKAHHSRTSAAVKRRRGFRRRSRSFNAGKRRHLATHPVVLDDLYDGVYDVVPRNSVEEEPVGAWNPP